MERQPRWWLAGFCALFAIQVGPWWYPVPDGAHYLSVARSIAEGGPIRRLGMSNIGYFPGYMALIWPPFLFQDRPFLLLSIQQWFFAVALILGTHRWFRRVIPGCAVLATGVTMANIAVWVVFRRTLSEIAFAASLIWAANLIHQADDGAGRRGSWARFIGAGLCLAFAALIRPTACALGIGFGLSVFLAVVGRRMHWSVALVRSMAVCLPAAALVVATILFYRGIGAPPGGHSHTYIDDVVVAGPGWFPQIAEGVRLRICEVGRLLVPGMFKAYARAGQWFEIIVVIHALFFLLVGSGWWHWVRRGSNAFALAIPFYMGVHVFFPFEQGTRYVMPIVAPLLASLWFSLERVADRRARLFAALMCAHLAVSAIHWVAVDAPMARRYDRQWPNVDNIASMIAEEPGAVMVFGVPLEMSAMLMLATDRPVDVGDPQSPIGGAVRWVVGPGAAEAPAGFRPRGSAGDYRVFGR